VVRFQQWQAQRKAAGKAAEHVRDVQDALMTQLAVAERGERVARYGQLLLEEVASQGQPAQPLARHIARATKTAGALQPAM
jgi:hypothetical protein